MTPEPKNPRESVYGRANIRRNALILVGAALLGLLATYSLVFGVASPSGLWSLLGGGGRFGPGYVGIAEFGDWRLICMPEPQAQEGSAARAEPEAGTTEPGTARPNACRINQEMPASGQDEETEQAEDQIPKAVIIAVNFSLAGDKRTPSAMLRLPSTARAGDVITLRLDEDLEIKATVRACASGECMAAGNIGSGEWARLSQAHSLQVKIPAAERQWVLLNLSVEGLGTAIAAMNRAEISAQD